MEAKVNNFQNNAKDSNIILTSESNEMDLSVKLSKIFSYNGHNVSFIKNFLWYIAKCHTDGKSIQ